MDADEALQMFFDEEDANVPIARFSDSDLPESDDVELTDDWAGYPCDASLFCCLVSHLP